MRKTCAIISDADMMAQVLLGIVKNIIVNIKEN